MKQDQRRARRVPRSVLAVTSACLCLVGSMAIAQPASPKKGGASADASAACASRVNNTFNKLLDCVTLDGVRSHQGALQSIADANGGTRAAGTAG